MEARIGASFALGLTCAWVLAVPFLHELDSYSMALRGASATAGCLLSLGVLVLSRRAPQLFGEHGWTITALVSFFGGSACVCAASFVRVGWLSAAGFVSGWFGVTWLMVLVGLSAVGLERHRRFRCLSIGFAAKSALLVVFVFAALDIVAWAAVLAGAGAAGCLIVRPLARSRLEAVGRADAPRDLETTNPGSFLPFSNKLFVMILLFMCLSGYGYKAFLPVATPFEFVAPSVLALIALVALLVRAAPSVDDFFYTALIMAFVGLTVGAIWNGGVPRPIQPLALGLSVTGFEYFTLFMYLLLFELAARNPFSGIGLIAFGSVALTFGLAIDAALWLAAFGFGDAGVKENVVLLAFFVAFIVYAFLFLRGYSFEDTIGAVIPMSRQLDARPVASIEERCETLAEERGLTARERDIFLLLARGRNGRYIQDALVVSQNTVKTHTRNLYLKLDVHSHQELIDLVEQTS